MTNGLLHVVVIVLTALFCIVVYCNKKKVKKLLFSCEWQKSANVVFTSSYKKAYLLPLKYKVLERNGLHYACSKATGVLAYGKTEDEMREMLDYGTRMYFLGCHNNKTLRQVLEFLGMKQCDAEELARNFNRYDSAVAF